MSGLIVVVVSGVLAEPALGAEVLVSLHDGLVDARFIAVNVGDTVTWRLDSDLSGSVAGIGEPWGSPVLTNVGATFSYTLTNAGFYAYQAPNQVGTIDVLAWAGAPPLVTIINPIGGFHLPSNQAYQPPPYPTNGPPQFPPVLYPILASVALPARAVARVEFFANGHLIGTATNAPYQTAWTNPPPGQHVLTAKLTDAQQNTSVSRTVPVVVGGFEGIFGPHRLPDGEFLCYFSQADWGEAISPNLNHVIRFSDLLPATAPKLAGQLPLGYGVWLDPSAVGASSRFYEALWEFPRP